MSRKIPKPSKTKNPQSYFDNLVRNGLDFLEKAISQLDKDPKHSVINFYTAVEIFLKAPLVHEHWTLVVAERNVNHQNYEAGDFISVSFEDACARLEFTLNKPISISAKEAFNKVRKHRNRMVHFYHSGLDDKQREAIKLEQAQAWFELNRFVTDTWREQFEPFAWKFSQMERNLIANNDYAQAKYEDLKPKIEDMKKRGNIFQQCPKCKIDASHVKLDAPRLESHNCLVCFHSEKRIKIDCPACGDPDQYVIADDGFNCDKCNHQATEEGAVFDLLDQNTVRGTKDYYLDSATPCNCDECQGYQTVCDYEEGYLCTNCFSYFDTVGQCEWCSESMTGNTNTENTYISGCKHCEGYVGYHADD